MQKSHYDYIDSEIENWGTFGTYATYDAYLHITQNSGRFSHDVSVFDQLLGYIFFYKHKFITMLDSHLAEIKNMIRICPGLIQAA